MPTIDAMISLANAQKEFVAANKESRDKFADAAAQLGSTNAGRISQGRKQQLENSADELQQEAQKTINTWESSIGMAAAGVSLVKAVSGAVGPNGTGAAKTTENILQALTQLASTIQNTISQNNVLEKQMEKAQRLKQYGDADASAVQGI